MRVDARFTQLQSPVAFPYENRVPEGKSSKIATLTSPPQNRPKGAVLPLHHGVPGPAV